MSGENVDMSRVLHSATARGLVDDVSQYLLNRTRGAYWAEPVANEHVFFAARRSYYVPLPEGTRKVVTPYYRILRKEFQQRDGQFSIIVPSLAELHHAFDQADERKEQASYRAVINTFSPGVAMVDSVGNQLSPFKLAFTMYLQKGRALPERGPISTQYVHYMFALKLLIGDRKDGYQLSEFASGYIEHYRKMYAQEGIDFDAGDPTPFLALCIQDPEYLSKEFRIGIPKSYFGLLHSLFVHRLALSFVRDRKEPGIDIRSLASFVRQRGHGKLNEAELQTRLGNLVRTHLVKDLDTKHERFAIGDAWFDLARVSFEKTHQTALAAV